MSAPSRWTGYWEQDAWGQQPMLELVLRFDDVLIEGQGYDVVGPFTFAGRIAEGGQVEMTKQYLGRHAVLYRGYYDGEGTIAGEWHINRDSGRFHLRLARTADAAEG